MLITRSMFSLLLLGSTLGGVESAVATPYRGGKILLHVRPATTKVQCSGSIPTCCADAVSHGSLNTNHHLFVLAAPSDSTWTVGDGIAGIQFGID
ncbi:MAG: hypothetical protein SGI90_15640 [Candidatus Eisenbacteria bacterium]|nr:hypothetical protein [Candidatus Eisenbacteria bacterium]